MEECAWYAHLVHKFNKRVVCPHVSVRFSLYRLRACAPPIG